MDDRALEHHVRVEHGFELRAVMRLDESVPAIEAGQAHRTSPLHEAVIRTGNGGRPRHIEHRAASLVIPASPLCTLTHMHLYA
jgi:hypothetical protein